VDVLDNAGLQAIVRKVTANPARQFVIGDDQGIAGAVILFQERLVFLVLLRRRGVVSGKFFLAYAQRRPSAHSYCSVTICEV